MKYILYTLFYCLIGIVSFGQLKSDTSRHLVFKGVPIDGTLEQYVSKMKEGGFVLLGTENGVAQLKGDFAGYKSCLVGVSTLKNKDLVYKIGVAFPDKDTWSTLAGNYFELKEMLTEKYGKPAEEVEKFETTIQPNDDGKRFHNVIFDKCKYYSKWKTISGEIQLSIEHLGVVSCFVKLGYFDKINGDAIKKQALDDL